VVVYNLNVISIAVTPNKTNAPLVVDSNAMAPCAIAFQ
jgi:hypothetical protein